MTERVPVEVFPPGDFIREELEARGWSQIDLAAILGRHARDVSEIITAKRSISPETAKQLAAAFGTDPRLWMNLESIYRLSRVARADETVSRRARLYEKAPLREMIQRHWIEPSDNIEVLEKKVIEFFENADLDKPITFMSHAARKSTSSESATASQLAWLFRAKKLSKSLSGAKFSEKSFRECLSRLRQILPYPRELHQVPAILSKSGIRFLIIEPLSGARIDGACFWLDRHSPVVALSLRYDRIDWFWHTLAHELAHVQNKDGMNSEVTIDTELLGGKTEHHEKKSPSERRADEVAAGFLIPPDKLNSFMARVRPFYSAKKIKEFAATNSVHPGIVVGQLQHRREISYAHNRNMLVKVRQILISSSLTDGWGCIPTAMTESER
ncbi:MAG TPA: helix-turn-helix domain-containing protein [Terriglobia bacterium]|nr:helix-turn-helix domain-containing protein [Terriglobia bacterium]